MIENDLVESINTEKNTILDFKRILRTLSPLYVAILITYVAILGYVNLLYVSLLELEKIELLTFPIGVLIGAFTLCIAAIIGGKLKKKYLYLTITIVVFIQHILMFFTLFYIKFHMTLMARDYFLKFPVLIEVASNLGYNVPRILTATLVSITISFLLHYELANSSKTILTTNMRKLLLSILLIFSIIVTVIYSQVSYSIKREITSNRAVLATYNELYKNELEKNQEGSLSNDINLEDIRNNKENVFFIQL